jgi:CRP-like cAMP-binding protein
MSRRLWPNSKLLSIRPEADSEQLTIVNTKDSFESKPASKDSSPRAPLNQRVYKYRYLWRKALFKARIRKAMGSLNDEILLFGTANEILDVGTYEQIMALKHKKAQNVLNVQQVFPWYVLSPYSRLSSLWGIVVGCMLVYTVTYMPLRLGFQDPVYYDAATLLDITVDFIFIIDAVLNCFTAYRTEDGLFELSLKRIFFSYLKTWLLVDLVACIPMTLIEAFIDESQSSGKSSISKVARLPRLYKVFRIVRFSKIMSVCKRNPCYIRLTDYFELHTSLVKLGKFMFLTFICVHNLACLWHFAAKFEDFSYETWVMRLDFIDKSAFSRYIASVYWAITTIATVGYGDINARTGIEMIFSFITMAIGVAFYSMIISSVTSLLSAMDVKEAKTAAKLAQALEFAQEVGLSAATIYKIRRVIRQNASNLAFDKQELFRLMPKTLKHEAAMSMFNGIAKLMPLLNNKDASFVVSLFSRLKSYHVVESLTLYEVGSIADEVFFIIKGRVELVVPECEAVIYKSYFKGSYFGEIELIHNIVRIDTAKTNSKGEMQVLSLEDFHYILEEFPDVAKEIKHIALERLRRNTQQKVAAYQMLKLKFTELHVDVSAFEVSVENFEARLKDQEGPDLDLIQEEDLKMKESVEHMQAEVLEIKDALQELCGRLKARE